jgi:hypothetical protein
MPEMHTPRIVDDRPRLRHREKLLGAYRPGPSMQKI